MFRKDVPVNRASWRLITFITAMTALLSASAVETNVWPFTNPANYFLFYRNAKTLFQLAHCKNQGIPPFPFL